MKLNKREMYKLLRGRKIKVSTFCKDMGLTEMVFHRWMNGQNLTHDQIQDVADYFDVSIYDIAKFKGLDY